MATHITRSPEETIALGRDFAATLVPGSVVGLLGDLGAGKTQFVKGIAQGLGSSARVHSPTFALLNQYDGGRLPVHHLDLYRLETAEALASAMLEDYLQPAQGVAVIEWFERLQAVGGVPPGARLVRFETVDETTRSIEITEA